MGITNQNWKLFQNKISLWQDAYMDRLNQEYIDILTGEDNPSDRFWHLEKRIKQDKKKYGVLIQLWKQTVVYALAALINDGVIMFADIVDFSDELQETVRYLCDHVRTTER